MAKTLFLRLEGVLQAWGERARWSVRDTATEPTKSGVVGLLASALGEREDEALRKLSRAIRMGVRCDREGKVIRDYHTVSGGVMSGEGKIKINRNTKLPETVVSERYYLCDASFLVAIQVEAGLIEWLAEAVQNPTWPIYLGRKSCVPGRPVFEGIGDYATLRAALMDRREGLEGNARVVWECGPMEGVRRREEIDSRSRRTYLPRYVREEVLRFDIDGEVE
jgi:CRISPR system Cascade subunit CasD